MGKFFLLFMGLMLVMFIPSSARAFHDTLNIQGQGGLEYFGFDTFISSPVDVTDEEMDGYAGELGVTINHFFKPRFYGLVGAEFLYIDLNESLTDDDTDNSGNVTTTVGSFTASLMGLRIPFGFGYKLPLPVVHLRLQLEGLLDYGFLGTLNLNVVDSQEQEKLGSLIRYGGRAAILWDVHKRFSIRLGCEYLFGSLSGSSSTTNTITLANSTTIESMNVGLGFVFTLKQLGANHSSSPETAAPGKNQHNEHGGHDKHN